MLMERTVISERVISAVTDHCSHHLPWLLAAAMGFGQVGAALLLTRGRVSSREHT